MCACSLLQRLADLHPIACVSRPDKGAPAVLRTNARAFSVAARWLPHAQLADQLLILNHGHLSWCCGLLACVSPVQSFNIARPAIIRSPATGLGGWLSSNRPLLPVHSRSSRPLGGQLPTHASSMHEADQLPVQASSMHEADHLPACRAGSCTLARSTLRRRSATPSPSWCWSTWSLRPTVLPWRLRCSSFPTSYKAARSACTSEQL